MSSAYAEGQEFLGYPVLSLLSQRTEYRTICKILATQMTRKWIKVISRSGKGAQHGPVQDLERFMKRLKVRQAFRRAAEVDFFFGRGHVFLEFGGERGTEGVEPAHSVGDGHDSISREKVSPKNPLTGLRPIEPVWVYPTDYDTTDPLSDDWYRPRTWLVLGRAVHSTRLLRFVGEEVSDLLKPAYSFGGLSKTQIAKPYVDNWLNTRQAVADLLRGFTTYVLKTNLMATLRNGTAEDLFERLHMFVETRDNSGVMVADQATEDFSNVSAPLGGLDHLQAQSQEQMCSASRIPLVWFTGITPSGLNASSADERAVFAETIRALQVEEFEANLRTVFNFCQLSLWGRVDEDLDFEFLPVMELGELEEAQRRATDAGVDVQMIDAGVLSQEEVRGRLARSADTNYNGLDVDRVPRRPNAGPQRPVGGREAPEAEEPWDGGTGLSGGLVTFGRWMREAQSPDARRA
jgi:phage-related protein (TIGR01555 family)